MFYLVIVAAIDDIIGASAESVNRVDCIALGFRKQRKRNEKVRPALLRDVGKVVVRVI